MAIVINGSGTVTGLAVGGLPDGTVDAGTLATNSVDSAELIDGAVDDSHMAAMAASKLTGTVATANIADNAITLAKMASGTDGNIISFDASGNPVAIATGSDGQVLTSTGAGSPPAFEALPAGGLSEADTWYLDTAFNVSNNSTNVLTNLSRTGTAMGTGMTESSGIFTFPSTGFWLITFQTALRNSVTERYWYTYINESTDSGSSYGVALQNASNSLAGGTNTYTMNNISLIRDVTNISTYRASFSVFAGNGQSGHVIQSGVSTNMRFVKLGET
jgi:hypothetical protein